MGKQKKTAASKEVAFDPRRVGRYRPRILPHHLRALWQMGQKTGKPMTVLVAEALEAYLSANGLSERLAEGKQMARSP